ncbi:NAD(P)-dependent alcohol dehydrogenase [Phaeocystidibacter luteus]|uniref:NAD(P)-dependent alcohol dehydrogenase n=1 Tax=Phaeocystidibacter luteus TaxID=911197 RepID=A0A6N6RMG8_9FLAO|nr:NAD(P)-dependent alcohol dehydrogenase [Phaeocystidibacter luteus]KAB2814742.1 NAD(P)-dependent alcohol dehydrogenase [Phaeocystidibacter luteus]
MYSAMTTKSKMRAAVMPRYGTPSDLKLVEKDIPQPADNEVQIRVHATAVNDFDLGMIKGRPYVLRMASLNKPKYPILGLDVAGEVSAVGKKVSKWKVGDRVVGDLSEDHWGGFGEYACARETSFSEIPVEMSYVEAASLPHAGLLALQAIRQIDALQPGKSIAVNGAGGGVGPIVIKLAKRANMQVTAIDSAEKLDFLKELGADEVIDYKVESYQKERRDAFDFIIDCRATGRPPCYALTLKKGGRFTAIGGASNSLIGLLTVGSIINLFGSKKLKILGYKPNSTDIAETLQMCEDGIITPMVDSVYPLTEIKQAFEKYENFGMKGRIVICLE